MTLPEEPEGCTCAWTVTFHEDGHRSGAIHVAAEVCPAMPHFRRFNEQAKPEVACDACDGVVFFTFAGGTCPECGYDQPHVDDGVRVGWDGSD